MCPLSLESDLGVMAHACTLAFRRQRQKDQIDQGYPQLPM